MMFKYEVEAVNDLWEKGSNEPYVIKEKGLVCGDSYSAATSMICDYYGEVCRFSMEAFEDVLTASDLRELGLMGE